MSATELPEIQAVSDETARVHREFVSRARAIPEVRIAAGGDPAERNALLVLVPSLWSEAAERVYELQAEILRSYPEIHLEVEIQGIHETGERDRWLETLLDGTLEGG